MFTTQYHMARDFGSVTAMLLRAIVCSAILTTGVSAAPSPATLNGGLSLLIDNDLQGQDSSLASSGLLVLDPRLPSDAARSCEALGESLWSPEGNASSIIQNNLDYLKYTGSMAQNSSSRFWIAPRNLSARVIDIDGHVYVAKGNQSLPVLCSQSAPFSNETFQDTSARWQTSVFSNGEHITGFRDRLSFRFLGIRYASEPERFTYPTPYIGNGSELPATAYGSACAQAGNVGSEDCLFLNIWTTYLPDPSSSAQRLKPVMFWIHGGAFTGGTANDATFDGGNLASRGDVVVVAVNYRLSTLGFLALDDGATGGNFGLADQVAALDWVRAHIADFGGDADRITVFGQSAGAASVRALLASPRAVGKFAGAIPLSNLGGINYGTTYSKYYTIEEAMQVAGNAVLAATNCTGAASRVDCLRAVPAATLVSLDAAPRYLVVDGTYLTSDELALSGGDDVTSPPLPVRVMMGTARDDGAPFISYPTTTNQSAYLESQGFSVPSADVFPVPALANGTLALFNMSARLATDGIFTCADQATAYAGLQSGRLGDAVYFYQFNRTYQMTGWPGLDVCEPPRTAERPDGDPAMEYFKCHSGELYYVFGNLARQGLPLRDEFDLPFEQFVVDSFSAFARTYDPNPDLGFLAARGYDNTIAQIEGAGAWMPATKEEATMRVLQWPSVQRGFAESEQCESLGLGLDYYLGQS
ncbi:Alpha/Beta hydrolase protein [Xylariomycetidae sp. FL2044]|nr:Alpha/Beta hydrolase protein [Xylariomycetidae sp. FL2044]